MRKDEAIDRNGKIKRVKYCGSIYPLIKMLKKDYRLFYDEDEVYHIEEKTQKKIIKAFSCDSWDKAKDKAVGIVYCLFDRVKNTPMATVQGRCGRCDLDLSECDWGDEDWVLSDSEQFFYCPRCGQKVDWKHDICFDKLKTDTDELPKLNLDDLLGVKE